MNQLREEKELRADADKDLERDLREHSQSLDKRLGQLSDQLAKLERDFTERLSHETQSLREEIKRRNDDTRNTIERMFGELSQREDRSQSAGRPVRRNREVPEPGHRPQAHRQDRKR